MLSKLFFMVLLCEVLLAKKIVFPPELQSIAANLHAGCLQKQKLTEEDFKAFDLEKKTPKMMCYVKCVLQEFRWINEDEVVQYDFIKENIHPVLKDATLPYLEKCGKQAKGKQCEKTYNFFHCMNKAEPENWVLM